MKIYKCDNCGAGCAEPENWTHVRHSNYVRADFCHMCTLKLIDIAVMGQTKEEADMQNEKYRKEIF
jgi:hypothetical protein